MCTRSAIMVERAVNNGPQERRKREKEQSTSSGHRHKGCRSCIQLRSGDERDRHARRRDKMEEQVGIRGSKGVDLKQSVEGGQLCWGV